MTLKNKMKSMEVKYQLVNSLNHREKIQRGTYKHSRTT